MEYFTELVLSGLSGAHLLCAIGPDQAKSFCRMTSAPPYSFGFDGVWKGRNVRATVTSPELHFFIEGPPIGTTQSRHRLATAMPGVNLYGLYRVEPSNLVVRLRDSSHLGGAPTAAHFVLADVGFTWEFVVSEAFAVEVVPRVGRSSEGE